MSGFTPEQRDLLVRLGRSLELAQVRPVRLDARLEADVPAPTEMELAVESELSVDDRDGTVVVLGSFRLRGKVRGGVDFLKLRYDAAATYAVRDGTWKAAELELFAQTSTMVHLWPYFRAFAQGACGQLQVPPVPIPPFRVGDPRFHEWKAKG